MTHSLVHVNVLNLALYEEAYGCSFGRDSSELYRTALPHFLDLFKELHLQATFFVVARELEEVPEARAFCINAMREGHEIANHSFSHPPDFAGLSVSELSKEISRAHDIIGETTGIAPKGFRGPWRYADSRTLKLLSSLGYRYDSSVFSGWAALAAKVCYLRDRRSPLALRKSIGRMWDVFAPNKAYNVDTGRGILIKELPVVGLPFFRTPFDTAALYQFGDRYLECARRMLDAIDLQYLIHVFDAVDLFDFGDVPAQSPAASVPAARWGLGKKEQLVRKLLTGFPGRNISTLALLDELDSRSTWSRMSSSATT